MTAGICGTVHSYNQDDEPQNDNDNTPHIYSLRRCKVTAPSVQTHMGILLDRLTQEQTNPASRKCYMPLTGHYLDFTKITERISL